MHASSKEVAQSLIAAAGRQSRRKAHAGRTSCLPTSNARSAGSTVSWISTSTRGVIWPKLPIASNVGSACARWCRIATSQAAGSPNVLHRTANPILISLNRTAAMLKCAAGMTILPAAGSSCDEYPFASTYEGGGGATVRRVPLIEQYSQGGTISIAYTLCGIIPEIPGLKDFLVIPVVSAPRSFSCGMFSR